MGRELERIPAVQLLAIFLFIGSIVFVIFEFIRTPFTNPLILFAPLFSALLYIVTAYGQFIPIVLNPNFQALSGVNGTVYDPTPIPHGGNKVGYRICLFKRDVPRSTKRRANKGIGSFFTWLAGCVVVEIIADATRWNWVQQKHSEVGYGCLQLEGRLDNNMIESKHSRLLDLLERKSKRISQIKTEMAYIDAQLALAAKSMDKNIDKSSEFIRKVADRVKNVKILTKGGGHDLASAVDEEPGGN